jgi:hypothetical protein
MTRNTSLAELAQRVADLEARVGGVPGASPGNALGDFTGSGGADGVPVLSDAQLSSALERLLLRGDTLGRVTSIIQQQLLNNSIRSGVNTAVDGLLGPGAARGNANGDTRSFASSVGQIGSNLLDSVFRAQRYR